MRRPLTLLLALALGAACSVLVACGSSNPHLLSGGRADRLNGELDDVASAVDGHQCKRAIAAASRLQSEVSSLPRDTDPGLQQRLQDGAANLRARAAEECVKTTTTETTTETVTTPTATTPTATETTTTPTTTTPTTTTPTTTTTTPTTTSTTPDSGGSTVPPPGNG